jgi:hypothetical protein
LVYSYKSIIIGADGVSLSEGHENSNSRDFLHIGTTFGEPFFIFEPGTDLEFNMTKSFRFELGISYRITPSINLPGIPYNNRSGLNAHLIFNSANSDNLI